MQEKSAEKVAAAESKQLQTPGDIERESREEKKKKRESSQRSRSRSGRSRSREGKKHKHKQKSKKKHSRSRQSDHLRRSKQYKRQRYDRDSRDRRDRDRREPRPLPPKPSLPKDQKLGPNEIPMPLPAEMAMPPIPGERRKRQRSRSPLGYYRRNQNNNDGQFWDSFSWVPRMNSLSTVTNSALANTKKMRRLMITNIPYEIGITEDDLRNLITRFMAQNYLKDEMNSCPVLNLEINEEEHNVAVELSSVEETCRVCKLEKIELFKGTVNGIIRLGDSCYGNNIVTQAQTAAQAQAAAFAAINVLQNKRTNFSVDQMNKNNNTTASTLIRVTNAVTPYMAGQLTKEQWDEYEEDLIEGLSQFGTILHHWFVTKDEKEICADPGNLFIEYESKKEAEKAMEEMQGRIYDERTISLYFVPRDLYYQNFKKNLTPPVLKDKN